MLTSNRPDIVRALGHFGQKLLLLLLWDCVVVTAVQSFGWRWLSIEAIPLALYGSVIGIVVAFRNNSAYARWWEARTLWGQVVNCSRNLARQLYGSSGRTEAAERHWKGVLTHQIAYVHALRGSLRGREVDVDLAELAIVDPAVELQPAANIPAALQRRMGILLAEAQAKGWLQPLEWHAIERTLSDLMNAQGGLERIKHTPLPRQYDYFVMFFVQIYCMLLPLGLVAGLGWLTPLGSTVVSFMFLALDRIGRSLEDPFDNSVYDIPMTAITTRIELELRQVIGDENLPQLKVPVEGVLA